MALLPLRGVGSGLEIQSRADTKYGAGCHTVDGIRLTTGFGSFGSFITLFIRFYTSEVVVWDF